MGKVIYRRREFLEPHNSDQTAYAYAYIERYGEQPSKGARKHFDYDCTFGLHDGTETLHLHIEFDRKGRKVLSRDISKLRKLATIANEMAAKLEKLNLGESELVKR